MGFPPGVAEELVIKVLRKCDPKNWHSPNGATKLSDTNDEIMCSTVAQEVEVIAEEDLQENESSEPEIQPDNPTSIPASENTKQCQSPAQDISSAPPKTEEKKPIKDRSKAIPDDYKPPVIPTQKNSDTYNGAERDNYLWSQTITELGKT